MQPEEYCTPEGGVQHPSGRSFYCSITLLHGSFS